MENNNQNTIEKLNHLIAIAEDGKEGYENAAEDVKNDMMKSSFLTFAQERAFYAMQLRQIVQELNGDAEDKGGGSVGSMHRVWMDLKGIFTGGDPDAIINACITGEDAAVKEYQLVLEDNAIVEIYKPGIREQLNGIQHALSFIKSQVKS
jgi:uncharacterized protein (TIGR02284 family)